MRSVSELLSLTSERRRSALLVLLWIGSALGLACFGPLETLRAQSVVYVDPVLGQDQPGRGSAAMPLRSLTYATSLAASGVVFHEYRLAPGVYEGSTGEIFPIRPPDLAAFLAWPERVGAREVVLDAGGSAVAIDFAPPGVGILLLNGLDVCGADRALAVRAPANSPVNTVVEDSRLRGHVEVEAAGLAIAELSLRSVEVDGGVSARQSESSVLRFAFDRCLLRTDAVPSIADVVLIDGSDSWALVELRSCALLRGARSGLRLTESRPATWNLRFEHCTFVENGLSPGAFRGAALTTDLGPMPLGAGLAVENCLFVDNAHDAPVAGAFCSFGTNLIEQLDLLALGSNQLGQAQLVDVARGDLRLVPGSPGADLADISATTLFADREGDLRWTSVDPLGDLGADEFVWDSVHTVGDTKVGSTWHLVVETDPMLATVLVVGTDTTGIAPEVDGLRLAGAIVVVPTSVMSDPGGIARYAIPAPNDPSLIGLRLFWQAGVARAPFYGRNVWRTYVGR